jgi:hypothetical protein
MHRVIPAAVAGAVVLVLWASVASASSDSRGGARATIHVAIKQRLSVKTHSGKFSLEQAGLVKDAGTSVVSPNVGAPRIVSGQLQYPLTGTNVLTTAKGSLSLSFVGVSVLVNGKYYNEYGSWKVKGGTGIYAAWKGGGRFADVGTPSADNVEWDGIVSG